MDLIQQSDLQYCLFHTGGTASVGPCSAVLLYHYPSTTVKPSPSHISALSLPLAFHFFFLFHLIFHFLISYLYLTALLFLCFFVFFLFYVLLSAYLFLIYSDLCFAFYIFLTFLYCTHPSCFTVILYIASFVVCTSIQYCTVYNKSFGKSLHTRIFVHHYIVLYTPDYMPFFAFLYST